MGFQLSRQMYINGQKLFLIISIVIMLYLPLSLNQSATVHATLDPIHLLHLENCADKKEISSKS